jgi:hydrogenase nickel incorporation protein HypA/HybF
MHELSIAYSLIETAESAARDAGAQRVTLVHLRLGALSGVVEDALRFGFEVAAQDTLLDGARLEIERLPVMIRCPQCKQDVELPSIQRFRCPVCDAPAENVVQGRELELTSIEIEA